VADLAVGSRRRTSSGNTQLSAASGTATNHWYDQAGTTPFCGQPGKGRYSQVRSALARAAGRGQLVPSMTHTGRPSTRAESANDSANNLRNRAVSIEPSLKASHVLGQRRRNTVDKL
jgi:hypothetical protein